MNADVDARRPAPRARAAAAHAACRRTRRSRALLGLDHATADRLARASARVEGAPTGCWRSTAAALARRFGVSGRVYAPDGARRQCACMRRHLGGRLHRVVDLALPRNLMAQRRGCRDTGQRGWNFLAAIASPVGVLHERRRAAALAAGDHAAQRVCCHDGAHQDDSMVVFVHACARAPCAVAAASRAAHASTRVAMSNAVLPAPVCASSAPFACDATVGVSRAPWRDRPPPLAPRMHERG